MLTIRAHGVKNAPHTTLSLAQKQLFEASQPIRILNAPTGSGKTYAFLEIAKAGQLIFFIVPTVALANDIAQSAEKKAVPVEVWDGEQAKNASEAGEKVWAQRKKWLVTRKTKQDGGMIVMPLETFVSICFGKANYEFIRIDLAELLQYVNHFVFDEMHTLNERAVGFVTLWMVLVAALSEAHPEHFPFLNLLSATPSNLAEIAQHLLVNPKYFVDLTEDLSLEKPDRYLHGDVLIEWEDQPSFMDLIRNHLPHLLAEYGNRCLIIFDSLKMMAEYEADLYAFFKQQNIGVDEVFMINSQDRHGQFSLGSAAFDAGRTPAPRHRVILGTSSIEMGVNYEVRAAIMQPGLDMASFFQRVGRVARGGNISGKIIVPLKNQELTALIRVQKLSGVQDIQTLVEIAGQKRPLRQLSVARAGGLAYAYWSMLSRRARKPLYETFQGALNLLQLSQKYSVLDKVYIDAEKWERDGARVLHYLKQFDQTLHDVRGFNPTVMVQFKNAKPISMDAYWFMRHLNPTKCHYDDTTKIYVFNQTRSDCLNQNLQQIEVNALFPTGTSVISGQTKELLSQKYKKLLKQLLGQNFYPPDLREMLMSLYDQTGIIPVACHHYGDANQESIIF